MDDHEPTDSSHHRRSRYGPDQPHPPSSHSGWTENREPVTGAPDAIYFIADRYSWENVVLNALIVGIFLVRERVVRPEEMSLPQGLRHFEMSEAHIQTIVDFVVNAMPWVADENRVKVRYTGGGTALVPRAFLDSNGHQLEDWFADAFPPLKAHRGRLKLAIIEAVMQDLPRFVPVTWSTFSTGC